MLTLPELVPESQTLLALEPEELGLILLQVLNARGGQHHAGNFVLELEQLTHQPYGQKTQEVAHAVMEAWGWLVGQGLLADKPSTMSNGWVFVSRRGRGIISDQTAADYRKASSIPFHLLHPRIEAKVRPTLLRGSYDTAVFEAFKEVEVAVREAGNFGPNDYGVDLMRDAFRKESGPLTNKKLPVGEQEALSHLMAGAIGWYKNPASHRTVTITDPTEAVEMVMLASHLLRIVDSRRPPPAS